MINFPIIDPHIHLWDQDVLRYPWLDNHPELNRSFLMSDYDQAKGLQEVEALVFVQCECEKDKYLDELAWVQSMADNDSRLKGIIPWAPLDQGDAIGETLAKMSEDPRVKGIRLIIQFEDDPDFCMRPGFIRGVQLLGELNMHFELTIDPFHFPRVIKLIEACPDTRFVLDHIGNPDISGGKIQPWKDYLKSFADSGPHFCKFSNLVCNANLANWKYNDFIPYAETVFETFGAERIMWASDWPHALRASSWQEWFDCADQLTNQLCLEDRKKIYYSNAKKVYNI